MTPTTRRNTFRKTATSTAAVTMPQLPETKPARSVEEMLNDISLVLWLTQRVKSEMLADAAPTRASLVEAELVGCN